MKSRYDRRKKKYKVIIFTILIIVLIGMISTLLRNDVLSYYDIDAQHTLDIVGNKNVEVHWNEHRFIEVMHEMTHQKIKAGIKIGAVPMTQKNIDKMIKLCKNSKYENKDYLLSVLDKWHKNDFSFIQWQHNKLRSLSRDSTKDTIAISGSSSKGEHQFINNVFKEN